MDIFLLGNGYDLHHVFPTRYIDFLNVVNFMIKNESKEFSTVGEVFSESLLQDKNDFIKSAYEKHSRVYNDVPLNQNELKYMIELAKNNRWFKYFSETLDNDMGWIDFEKEIAFVIKCFENFFKMTKGVYVNNDGLFFDLSCHPEDGQAKFVIKKFKFFFDFDGMSSSIFAGGQMQKVHKKYQIEYPVGSKCFAFNKKSIISELHNCLLELSCILKLYLKMFIDEPTK